MFCRWCRWPCFTWVVFASPLHGGNSHDEDPDHLFIKLPSCLAFSSLHPAMPKFGNVPDRSFYTSVYISEDCGWVINWNFGFWDLGPRWSSNGFIFFTFPQFWFDDFSKWSMYCKTLNNHPSMEKIVRKNKEKSWFYIQPICGIDFGCPKPRFSRYPTPSLDTLCLCGIWENFKVESFCEPYM